MLIRLRVLAAACLTALSAIMPAAAQQPGTSPAKMSAAEAHQKATAGEVMLIDIRTPEEWRETGLPASAHAIAMQEEPKAFAQRLVAAVGGDKTRAIALICRTGNRSSALQAEMIKAGFTKVSDVTEGVVGGRNGTGWLKSGLPIRPGSMASVPPTPNASARASVR